MNRYESYKDSEIDWIGEIPEEWFVYRSGKFFTERSEKVDDITYPPLSVTMSGIVDQLSHVAKTNDGENRKLVKKDDFVINSRSDRKGSSGIAPRNGSVSLINIVLEPNGITSQFILHLFKSYYFKEEFFRNGKGIHWDLWTTRWEQFKNINIPVPSLQEQKLIARYLDKKTAQLDLLIEKIEKKIALLQEKRTALINQCVTKGLDPNVEMKDSGIEWIGNIPKHWGVKKLKHLSSIELSSVDRHEHNNERKVSICHYPNTYYNEFINSNTILSSGTCTEIEFKKFSLRKGDIVLTKDSESPDDIGIPTFIINNLKNTVCGYHLAIVRVLDNSHISEFVYRYIESKSVKDYFYISSNGITRFGLGKGAIENLQLAIPPSSEQLLISQKISTVSETINSVVKKLSHKINCLKEYRQALISSVVTGKVRVTEAML